MGQFFSGCGTNHLWVIERDITAVHTAILKWHEKNNSVPGGVSISPATTERVKMRAPGNIISQKLSKNKVLVGLLHIFYECTTSVGKQILLKDQIKPK